MRVFFFPPFELGPSRCTLFSRDLGRNKPQALNTVGSVTHTCVCMYVCMLYFFKCKTKYEEKLFFKTLSQRERGGREGLLRSKCGYRPHTNAVRTELCTN